ncbi:uncharacterized protein LOC134290763 [Aedes albopictus]|uniref:Integrase catalytic domain-containing protein n=1 Tax=Aedes albopictus TaxID=7160 RepID=A0ABM1YEK1_AEDAL
MALRRYYCLQKRLQQDQQLSEALNQQIASYLEKGYLRKLSPEELGMSFPRVWYLPMFPVTNPNKPGKTRLVWDAAAKAFGVSLNSVLVKGPDQLSSLFSIHIQFRQFRVGLTSDIKEMFHQVNMRRVDQQCQRIFWPDEDGELSVYVLCVMTFGACCSPSCAQYIMNINADRFTDKYPAAVETIHKKHYVDDMLDSVETDDEAITLAKDVKLIHAAGGFEIRNWLSNSKRVMTALNENSTADKDMDLNNELATEKILHRRRRQSKVTGPLTRDELRTAEHYLIRQAQQDAFPDEIAILRKHDQQTVSLPKSSVLHNLTPWLDAGGLLRMRGRISSCEYATEDAKNPIIMPRHHHATRLIITDYHHKFHHMNHETVVNELRQKYRIPRVRSAYFTVRKSCQKCKNDSSTPRPSIMADLPKARLAAYSRPFTFTGIDYFGPIEVMTGRRREKRWGMIATCLTIRAIHIEVVNSLTTDSCIMAIRNFMSRSGIPQAFYSDRGTNFVGANRTLNEIFEAIDHEGIMNEFVTTETTWHFNPPTAPHMGGSWERLVRTVKNNLLAICPAQRLTNEILRNLLTEVENTINSRPLTHVPVDDESAEALTPNHFLLGASNGTKPLTTLVKFDGAALRKNFCASQVIANIFWKRWIMDYLPDITKRTKWFSHSKPITVGDIVIIVDRRLPRNCWPKGKVIATCTGKDSQVRSATVRTSNGVYERPTINLAVLDVRREDQ